MATKFKIEHDFPEIPVDKFVAHLNDPKLNRMLEKGLSFDERKLVKKKESPEATEWQFQVKKIGGVPEGIKKIIKIDAFSWQEKSCLMKAKNSINWEIISDSKMLKFHGEGVWKLSPVGKGCKRVIEGVIVVDIPLVGKMLEGLIVSELLKSYEIEPQIQSQFYADV